MPNSLAFGHLKHCTKVKKDTPSRLYCWWWRGNTPNVHTAYGQDGLPKRMEGERGNKVSVSALPAGAYTTTYIYSDGINMRAPPTLTSLSWFFFHHDGMHARHGQSLCVLWRYTLLVLAADGVGWIHPARPYSRRWRGIHPALHTAGAVDWYT